MTSFIQKKRKYYTVDLILHDSLRKSNLYLFTELQFNGQIRGRYDDDGQAEDSGQRQEKPDEDPPPTGRV